VVVVCRFHLRLAALDIRVTYYSSMPYLKGMPPGILLSVVGMFFTLTHTYTYTHAHSHPRTHIHTHTHTNTHIHTHAHIHKYKIYVYTPVVQGTISDQPEKFFVSEIVREKIFFLYDQEIPYCAQVSAASLFGRYSYLRARILKVATIFSICYMLHSLSPSSLSVNTSSTHTHIHTHAHTYKHTHTHTCTHTHTHTCTHTRAHKRLCLALTAYAYLFEGCTFSICVLPFICLLTFSNMPCSLHTSIHSLLSSRFFRQCTLVYAVPCCHHMHLGMHASILIC